MDFLESKANLNAINYNESVLNEIRQILGPLIENFSFSHLIYIRFFKNGYYFALSDNINITREYLHYNSLNKKVFLEKFSNIDEASAHKFLWPSNDCKHNNGLLRLEQYNINIKNGINVTYNVKNDYLETFAFIPKKECSRVLDLYLNHFYILERFILYFKNKARHIFSYDKQVLAFSSFYQKQMSNIANIKDNHSNNKRAFFYNTNIKKIYSDNENTYIPKKTSECLYYLLHGKSTKEIAKILSISPRTVETNFHKIRNKFDLNSASRLVKLSKDYGINKLHLDKF